MSPEGVARSTEIYWPKTKLMPPECALKVIDGVVDRPEANAKSGKERSGKLSGKTIVYTD